MTDRRLAACVNADLKDEESGSTFTTYAPHFPKKHCCLKYNQTSLVCLSGKSNTDMNASMELWRNAVDRENPNCSKEDLSQCH